MQKTVFFVNARKQVDHWKYSLTIIIIVIIIMIIVAIFLYSAEAETKLKLEKVTEIKKINAQMMAIKR